MSPLFTTDLKKDDIAICIDNKPLQGNVVAPPLQEKEEYPVIDVYECFCGQKHIDVGLKSEYNYIRCYKCESNLPNGNKIHWCHPTRFFLK